MTVETLYEPVLLFADGGPYDFEIESIGLEAIEIYEIDDQFRKFLVPLQDYRIDFTGVAPLFDGGTVFFNRPHGSDILTVAIERNTRIVQLVDFPQRGIFSPDILEFAADRATMIAQEIAERKCDIVTGPVLLDPFYDDVYTLLHFDDADQAQTFLDNAPVPKVWTAVNTAKVDHANPRYGAGALDLDGTGDYITEGTITTAKWLHDGTTPYTLEWDLYLPGAGDEQLIDTGGATSSNHGVHVRILTDGSFSFGMTNGSANILSMVSATGVIPTAQYFTLTVEVIPGVGGSIYIDGDIKDSSTFTGAHSSSDATFPIRIGYFSTLGGFDYLGQIDEMRMTQASRYGQINYTPVVGAYPDSEFAVPPTQTPITQLVNFYDYGLMTKTTLEFILDKLTAIIIEIEAAKEQCRLDPNTDDVVTGSSI